MEYTDYKVVHFSELEDDAIKKLTDEVKKLMNKGWQPIGGVFSVIKKERSLDGGWTDAPTIGQAMGKLK